MKAFLEQLGVGGRSVSEALNVMSPSPGDETPANESRSSGGLAGVFRGLTSSNSKLSKSPVPQPQLHSTTSSLPLADLTLTRGAGEEPFPYKERLEQLRHGSLAERTAAADALRLAIGGYDFHPVLEIWEATKDLIDASNPRETRVAGWALLIQCTKYAYSTDLERQEFFRVLTAPAHSGDFYFQLTALDDLTNHGRSVAGFYYEIFPLLTAWLQKTYAAAADSRKRTARATTNPSKGKQVASDEEDNLSRLFTLIRYIVKFNVKFASDKVVGELLDEVILICKRTSTETDVEACIDVFDALITFSTIPNNKLPQCVNVFGSVHALVPSLQRQAWNTIGNLCTSHHGKSVVRILLDGLRNFPGHAKGKDHVLRRNERGGHGREEGPPQDLNGAKEEKEVEKESLRNIRGALSVLMAVVSVPKELKYPEVPLFLLVSGMENVASGLRSFSRAPTTKASAGILRLINSLMEDPDGEGKVNRLIAGEQWAPLFSVALQTVNHEATKSARKTAARSSANGEQAKPSFSPAEPEKELVPYQLKCLIGRVESLLRQQPSDFPQREDCVHFLTTVSAPLSDVAAELVMGHYMEHRSCLPSNADWQASLRFVTEEFFQDQNRGTLTRIRALQAIVQLFDFLDLVQHAGEKEAANDLVNRICSGLAGENDTVVLFETVSFLVRVSERADETLFGLILDSFKGAIHSRRAMTSALRAAGSVERDTYPAGFFSGQSLTNVVTRGCIQIFIRSVDKDASKATQAFDALVRVAVSGECETDARLSAMKMLFRLRANSDNKIYLCLSTDSDVLASSLFRTEASLAHKLAQDAALTSRHSKVEPGGHGTSRCSRSISINQGQMGDRPLARSVNVGNSQAATMHRLWSLPDADALPESPPERPSLVLFSRLVEDSEAGQETAGSDQENTTSIKMALNMGSWLDAITRLLHDGCDWELYSFILVHVPAQLSSHALLAHALPQIQELRRTICEMVRTNSVQEPPSSSGLRRYDVANCLFHTLSMIISHHQSFQKSDQDELIRAFMHGITDKTAKTCIHALSVCCHELPLSTSKSLVTILHKMSQVITQPLVAVHILEFLACLGRMPTLYSNFREDEFRVVFGICIRYLQYVRDKKRSARSTYASEPPVPVGGTTTHHEASAWPNPTDDLPQYVYALAYHVVIFWFLAVKVADRPKQVGWIAKNLFTDVDGTATNEEQAQVTMDFMQRVAFSDANDAKPSADFNEKMYGAMQTKSWVLGSSIVTIKQATESGWAEVTRRYPSGMSVFRIRCESTPSPAHQVSDGSQGHTGNTIYPGHLLLQLFTPVSLGSDSPVRPLPLPDDKDVERAIRLFDHNSAVDGHKVGVIYVGDGQSKEAEILANTFGSPDYHEFLGELGTLTSLKGATFNTQGLDREYETDGRYAYCWRDRVTEMVFHVTTQMPTDLERDAQCIAKKRHIGNDFVNIIWNDSGLRFHFDTFPSAFNYVNIVITPNARLSFVASREKAKLREEDKGTLPFFTVQVMSKPGFPEISPAAEPKLVSLRALPSFVRLMSLNASVFSLVWSQRQGGEQVSSWRSRLRAINRLRERYGPKQVPAPSPQPNGMGATVGSLQAGQTLGAQSPALHEKASGSMRDSIGSLRRSSVATFWSSTEPSTNRSSIMSTTAADNAEPTTTNGVEGFVGSMDFSRWA